MDYFHRTYSYGNIYRISYRDTGFRENAWKHGGVDIYNYRIPYLSISPTFSICPVHGYLEGEHFECPYCKREKQAKLELKLAELEKERAEVLNASSEI